jgi:hypothetical protein
MVHHILLVNNAVVSEFKLPDLPTLLFQVCIHVFLLSEIISLAFSLYVVHKTFYSAYLLQALQNYGPGN